MLKLTAYSHKFFFLKISYIFNIKVNINNKKQHEDIVIEIRIEKGIIFLFVFIISKVSSFSLYSFLSLNKIKLLFNSFFKCFLFLFFLELNLLPFGLLFFNLFFVSLLSVFNKCIIELLKRLPLMLFWSKSLLIF